MMNNIQKGILLTPPPLARYLTFSLRPDTYPAPVLEELANQVDGEKCVIGLGASLLHRLEAKVPGMRSFPVMGDARQDIPSTPAALWCWLRGEDRGELLHQGRQLERVLEPAFDLTGVIDSFVYRDSRDLSGYEDGTENPEGEDAVAASIVRNVGDGMDGSSFVAVQQWLHDLDAVEAMDDMERDHVIGRRLSDNEELEDAPASAHVKRTAQEDFEPEAFLLRRSMPWADENGEGLVFVAFGHSFYAFEAQLNRMLGLEDGIEDAIFRISSPLSGAYYWCPPMGNGGLDLSATGL